ncbi:tumor necrosis factor receptor superfamily member 8-like [Mixophyes fleayi]|uniref:tumor necrosis factor receptor superfamily member 8-like n=1 Tax=Mixophyes fleayi TaxID=3061075 RepID=UPI003F4DD917
MNVAQSLTLLFITAGTFQKAFGQKECGGTDYYNKTMRECCSHCPEGQVKRSPCVKDIEKDCAKPCKGFINWSRVPPKCETCKKCLKEDFLVNVQNCSLHSEAICQCQSGYYCQTPVLNTCARCVAHAECPPGQGVQRKGTAVQDTKCEVCGVGTYSNITSATEGCKLHTDCAKLDQYTNRKGNARTDAQCLDPGHVFSISTEISKLQESTWGDVTVRPVTTLGRDARYSTPGIPTHHVLSRSTSLTTSRSVIPTTKDGAYDTGKVNNVYVLAGIISVITLLIALLLIWKQKIYNLKLWLIKRKDYIPSKYSAHKTILTYKEDFKEGNLLQRQNSSPFKNVIPEFYQSSEVAQSERLPDDKPEVQQGRDHLNNRIEKIYIMNADTVLVGSISEVPNRRRSATMECESKENHLLVSRYPEQETSKVPVDELMLSVEEEEGEACDAKVILQV